MREEIELWLLVDLEIIDSTENSRCRYAHIGDCIKTMFSCEELSEEELAFMQKADFKTNNDYSTNEMRAWINGHVMGK